MIRAKIIGIILSLSVFIGPAMGELEQPTYKVVFAEDNIEMREYQPMIIAEVNARGERKAAIRFGFQLLADYILGENIARQVTTQMQAAEQQSQKIAMTAPVEIQSNGESWKISFLMPSEFSLDTLPTPKNKYIKLTEIPEQNFIILGFSGRIIESNLARHEKLLRDYIETHQIKVKGSPKFAFYNPPWVPAFMRRNEVMLELVD